LGGAKNAKRVTYKGNTGDFKKRKVKNFARKYNVGDERRAGKSVIDSEQNPSGGRPNRESQVTKKEVDGGYSCTNTTV